MTTFIYLIADLLKRINGEILYKIRNRADLTENTIVDAEFLIREYISTICYDIFDKITSPYGRTLDDLEVPLLPFEFDVNYTEPGEITAGSFVVGKEYTILDPGTTDFTLIGSADSEIGTSFTSTGAGTGTGTANYAEQEECILYRCVWPTKYDYATGTVLVKDFDTNTVTAILKAIEETIVSFAVYQWLMDSNIQGWEIYETKHNVKYNNLRGLMTRRINLKRTPSPI